MCLGLGPTWFGLGSEISTIPLWNINYQGPLDELDVKPDTIFVSSETPHTQFIVAGVKLKTPAVRSNRQLATLTDNIIDTRKIESWDERGIFEEVALSFAILMPFLNCFYQFQTSTFEGQRCLNRT
jgi:hypothetical protein